MVDIFNREDNYYNYRKHAMKVKELIELLKNFDGDMLLTVSVDKANRSVIVFITETEKFKLEFSNIQP